MIVVRADKGIDGDEAVAAGAVIDDHRLSPALSEAIRQEPRAEVRAATGAERQDQSDRTGRPGRLRRRLGCGGKGGESHGEGQQVTARQSHDPLPWRDWLRPIFHFSKPVGTFLFSLAIFMPAASAMVSASAAKSFCRYSSGFFCSVAAPKWLCSSSRVAAVTGMGTPC